jgi:hypothetical protein
LIDLTTSNQNKQKLSSFLLTDKSAEMEPVVELVKPALVGNAVGREFMRMAEGEELQGGEGDGEGDAHRSKRARTG